MVWCAAVVGTVQRRLSAACHAAALLSAMAVASPTSLPYLMAASAAIATVAAAMFATFAGIEWPQSQSGGGPAGTGCVGPISNGAVVGLTTRSAAQAVAQGEHGAPVGGEEAETARLIAA